MPLSTTSQRSEQQPGGEELLTVGEVARRLRVDATTVRRWISQGILEAVTLPHVGKRQSYRIRQNTLEQLMKAAFTPPAQ
jgi:excisionase family DNA binding protein